MTPPLLSRARVLPLAGLLLLGSCGGDPPPGDDDDSGVTLSGCGDGILDGYEECDEGEANSDTEADACRLDCSLPSCGDAVVDAGELCDDGATWGGDGCSPTCKTEDGPLEEEVNDSLGEAQLLPEGGSVRGSLPPGDRDCFAFEVVEDSWLSADVQGEEEGSCPEDTVIELYDPAGSLLALGSPGESQGCSAIDPVVEDGARFMGAGTWTACAVGFLDRPVPTYRLDLVIGEDSCDLEGVVFPPDSDPDGDGLVNACDPDDDNDGVDDVLDNCPDVPNGPDMGIVTTGTNGWVKDWLVVGPLTGTESTESCRPSDDQLLGDDATATAQLGDLVGELPWIAFHSPNRRINFLDVYGGPTPRESYSLVWLRSDTERTVTLAIGPDDGARVWVNGEEVIDISGCQGTNVDQFQAETLLLEGWNRVLVKVRDQGGGWGMFFRFLDGEDPVEGLEVSLIDSATWIDDQTDTDGDGVGDACDSTPAGG